jgi:intraflagellar transport protein 122
VHALQGDKYAYRDNLTDVVVQSMSSNSKIRLKCKELVKNISIYKDKLAAHLTERILIYGVGAEDSSMKYKLIKRVMKKLDA